MTEGSELSEPVGFTRSAGTNEEDGFDVEGGFGAVVVAGAMIVEVVDVVVGAMVVVVAGVVELFVHAVRDVTAKVKQKDFLRMKFFMNRSSMTLVFLWIRFCESLLRP